MKRILQHEDIQPLPLRDFVKGMRRRLGLDTLLPVAVGGSLNARINHGRWIVDCPNCRSAQVASMRDPWYICAECDEDRRYTVIFPAYHRAIEDALLKRPKVANRNWEPGEKLRDLQRENRENGVR